MQRQKGKATVVSAEDCEELLSPAKINLFLAVTGRRPDGYHELVSLMCPVALFDRLRIRFGGRGIRVTCDHPQVPTDSMNLAARAAVDYYRALKPRTRLPWSGIDIHIDKTIPVGAGLGGGSSNAASVLLTLNRRMGRPLSDRELAALGLTLGADVPFFLGGKAAIARGIGERLQAVANLQPMEAVIVYPGFGVSTSAVFGRLKLTLTKCEKKLKSFLLNKERFSARSHLCNDLETVTIADYPTVGAVKETLVSSGAEGVTMSGSGAAVFGLYNGVEDARKARSRIAASHPEWQVFQASLIVS